MPLSFPNGAGDSTSVSHGESNRQDTLGIQQESWGPRPARLSVTLTAFLCIQKVGSGVLVQLSGSFYVNV